MCRSYKSVFKDSFQGLFFIKTKWFNTQCHSESERKTGVSRKELKHSLSFQLSSIEMFGPLAQLLRGSILDIKIIMTLCSVILLTVNF